MARIVRGSAIVAAVTGLALALASVALAVKSGDWDGSTSQTYSGGAMPFSLEVANSKVTVIYYGADFTGSSSRCASTSSPGAQRLDPNTGFKGLTIKHDKFGSSFKDASGEHISIHGQFKGKTLSGSLTESFNSAGIHCSTGKVSFSAKPGTTLLTG